MIWSTSPSRCGQKCRRNRRRHNRARSRRDRNRYARFLSPIPALLSRRRETNVAGTGLSRERPGSTTTAGTAAAAGAAAGARRRGRRLVHFLMQRLQHPGGFLAAGNAEIEPRLAFARDRFRIVVAVIAALAAILLRHRRHHAPAQRAAFGEFHAVGDRHGLVVPRRFAVVAIAGGPLHHRRALLRRQRRGTIGGQQTGEEAVQPGALRFGERRAAGE